MVELKNAGFACSAVVAPGWLENLASLAEGHLVEVRRISLVDKPSRCVIKVVPMLYRFPLSWLIGRRFIVLGSDMQGPSSGGQDTRILHCSLDHVVICRKGKICKENCEPDPDIDLIIIEFLNEDLLKRNV